jgi:cyclase
VRSCSPASTRTAPAPVIASGGVGEAADLRDAFTQAHASAALVAGILHDGLATVAELESALAGWGIPVRPTPTHVP